MVFLAPVFALWLAASLGAPAVQSRDPRTSGGSQCFLVSQYRQWRDQDERTLYIRVNVHDYYRLTTAHTCSNLTYPNARLVIGGSDTICTASDWDVRVSKGTGGTDPAIPCQIQTMTKLTPEQASALPARYKPD